MAVGRVVWSPASPLYVTGPDWLGGMLEKEGRKSMASSEELIKQMFEENLGRAADPDVRVADSGLSSLQAVAFMKAVGEAYNVALPPEEMAKFTTLRDFIKYIDSHTSCGRQRYIRSGWTMRRSSFCGDAKVEGRTSPKVGGGPRRRVA